MLYISVKFIQNAAGKAVKQAGIVKYATTVYTLRYSFAAYIFTKRVNISKIQELIGHKDVEIAMIYPHILRAMSSALKSPLDNRSVKS